MNFAELRFWEYLLAGGAVLLVLRCLLLRWPRLDSGVLDKSLLLSLGLALLAVVSWTTFAIFLAVAIGTYVGLAWIQRYHPQHSMKYLLLMVPLQLLPLFYYKYSDFLLNRVLGLHFDVLRGLAIPVGISFYTFQKVAFVVDTLAFKHPRPGFLDYMNFAGFFPQIVAGPIERRASLLPQMQQFRWRWLPENINEGSAWIAVGLFFKCCLANNLANYCGCGTLSNPFLVWLANLAFGLRIYYDFAGYSLIAYGLARCLGINLTLNFLSPYCSTDITEFWRRWHVTLSQWFRDYVYIPLGGGRVRFWALNVAAVFIVSGIWHGAGWNFVLWGALHGIFLIINRSFSSSSLRLPTVVSWALTMFGCFFAWLCFYETNTPALIAKIKLLVNPMAYGLAGFQETLRAFETGDRIVLVFILFLAAATLILEWLSLRRKNDPYHYLRRKPALLVLVIITVLFSPGGNNGFIYFAF